MIKEYEKILIKEESVLFQRARCNWIQLKDYIICNFFFHSTTVVKKRRENIMVLKDAEGVLVSDNEELKKMARDYFQYLFYEDGASYGEYPIKNAFPSINDEIKREIEAMFTNEEITEAIFSMGRPFKGLGSDGLHVVFF